MSHTTTIKSVVISDKNALRAAVEELKSHGVRCELLENVKPRAYYSNQANMGVAPLVIHLADAAYDVGLYDSGDGTYEARTDFYGGSVKRVLGVDTKNKAEQEQAQLGKLYQYYGVCAAENQAAMQGFSTSRSTKADGTVQLVLTAA